MRGRRRRGKAEAEVLRVALEGAKTEEWPTVEGLIEVGDPEMAVEVKAAEEAGMKAEEEVAERLAKAAEEEKAAAEKLAEEMAAAEKAGGRSGGIGGRGGGKGGGGEGGPEKAAAEMAEAQAAAAEKEAAEKAAAEEAAADVAKDVSKGLVRRSIALSPETVAWSRPNRRSTRYYSRPSIRSAPAPEAVDEPRDDEGCTA